ncbi:Zinc finger CCCH domain-containing protein 36 [Linum perenne]
MAGCPFGEGCHFMHYAPGGYNAVSQIMNKPPPAPKPKIVPPNQPVPNGSTPPEPTRPASILGFGDTATAKVSIDASLAGSIIGKGGVNSKQICRQTGAKLSIREHETDPNLRNIELEGTLEQVGRASAMVRELLANIGPPGSQGGRPSGPSGDKQHPGSNYKTKICERFMNGSCSFGDRCHFAHGANEMRKSGPGM